MVNVTAGANPDELDQLAGRLTSAADRITAIQKSLNPRINSAPWQGGNAERFRQQWAGEHRRAIADAVAFLEDGAGVLHRNAQEQRDASRDGGAGRDLSALYLSQPGSGSSDDPADGGLVDFLKALGLSAEQIEEILGGLGDQLGKLGLLADILDDKALLGFIKGVGEVLDVVSVVIDFVKDVAENAGSMPMDEVLVHAVVETAARFVVDQGAGKVVELITPVLMSVVPVAGTAAGIAIGKVAGFVVDKAVDAAVGDQIDRLDDRFNIYDGPADAAVDGYRYLKQHDFNVADIAWDQAEKIGGEIMDGAENLYDQGADWVGDRFADVRGRFKSLTGGH